MKREMILCNNKRWYIYFLASRSSQWASESYEESNITKIIPLAVCLILRGPPCCPPGNKRLGQDKNEKDRPVSFYNIYSFFVFFFYS